MNTLEETVPLVSAVHTGGFFWLLFCVLAVAGASVAGPGAVLVCFTGDSAEEFLVLLSRISLELLWDLDSETGATVSKAATALGVAMLFRVEAAFASRWIRLRTGFWVESGRGVVDEGELDDARLILARAFFFREPPTLRF